MSVYYARCQGLYINLLFCKRIAFANVIRHEHVRNSSSYFYRASSQPLLEITLSQMLDNAVDKFGDNEAVVDCHQHIRKRYLQYGKDIDCFASGLVALGLKKGDRIGIWSSNCYQWLLTQLAATRLGLILVCINSLNQAHEMEYNLENSGVKVLVSGENCGPSQYYEILQKVIPELGNESEIVQSKRFPELERIVMISDKKFLGTLKFDDVVGAGGSEQYSKLESIKKTVNIHDPSTVFYTSGTTGLPKGVVLSHHKIVNMAYNIQRQIGFSDGNIQRLCASSPMFHVMGGMFCSYVLLVHGHCNIFPSPVYSVQKSMAAIQSERCTSVIGTPTMIIDILDHPDFDKYDFSSLTHGITGGASVPAEVVKLWRKKTNSNNLLVAYGATECTAAVTVNVPNEDPTLQETTVGKPLPHTEIKMVDDNGDTVPWDTPGEIYARGYFTMIGYWKDRKKTEKSFTEDGWFKTGDIGTMDQNGYSKIIGRISDMLIRGGENIYPKEIEDFLLTNPKISEVYVIGVPDKRLGETVCAWVLLKSGEVMTKEELKSFCKNKIASYKIPKHVQFVKEFPKLGTGKVNKKAMRAAAIADMKN